ncbi:hypothetical protein WME94_14160 [Sorangium sp. So ce429]
MAGLLLGGLALAAAYPGAFPAGGGGGSLGLVVVAGLLVGYGARLGSGCTSGHGVCGLSRLSVRLLCATMTFMVAGMAIEHLTTGTARASARASMATSTAPGPSDASALGHVAGSEREREREREDDEGHDRGSTVRTT